MAYLWNYYCAEFVSYVVLTAVTVMIAVVWNATFYGVIEKPVSWRNLMPASSERQQGFRHACLCVFMCLH